MRSFIVFIFVFILVVSCNRDYSTINKNAIVNDNIIDGDISSNFKTEFKYTSNIELNKYSDYQIIKLKNPWDTDKEWVSYLLYAKGSKCDTLWPNTDYKIAVPVERIAVASASGIGFLGEIHSLKNITAVSQKKFVFSKIIRNKIDNMQIREIGGSSQINMEQLLASGSEVFLQTPYSADLSNDSKVKAAGIPIAYNCDWLEVSPLGRAEWIKFVGLLMGKEKEADSIFASIESKYMELKSQALSMDSNIDFLVGGLYKDVWYMPAGGSYKAHLFNDASTSYTWKNTDEIASLPLSIESVIDKQLDADYWIECPYRTFAELEASSNRYSVFKAFKLHRVYHFLKQSRQDGANNYWERGVCRPDEVLSDLICIFHPDNYKAELHYYGKLQ